MVADVRADLAGDAEDIFQVDLAAFGGGADSDEHQFGGVQRGLEIGGGAESARVGHVLQQFRQALLVDGRLGCVQPLDDGRIDIDAGDVVALGGEAHPGNQAHISGADDR